MKRGFKSLTALVLVATLALSGAVAFGAENKTASEALGKTGTMEPIIRSDSAVKSASFEKLTEEEIKNRECSSENAPDKKHVLASRTSIVALNGSYVRASRNRREFEETCTYTAGTSEERACKYCSTWFTVVSGHEEKEEPSHTFSEDIQTVEGCDGATYTMRTCTDCGYIEVTVDGSRDETKHMTETVVTAATCDTDGITITKCTECDAVLSCELTPATGHNIYEKIVQNPKCFTDGQSLVSCTQCDYSRTETIPQLGRHSTGTRYTTQPTCTEPGRATQNCTLCGAVISEEKEIPALGHDYQPLKSTDHPCTEPTGLLKCTRCGDVKEGQDTVIPGHQFGNVIVVSPTCSKKGYSYKKCSVCGEEERIENSETDPVDHKFDDAEPTVVAPTCGSEGYSYRICTICGEKITVSGSGTPATGVHKLGIWTNYVLPTCGKGGSYNRMCSVCGYIDPEVITVPATGKHFYNSGNYGNCDSEKVCIKCGYVEKAATEHTLGMPKQLLASDRHTRKCTVSGCKYSVEEDCVGIDDHDCTTDVVCECGRVMVKGNASHTVSESYSYDEHSHYIICANEDCNAVAKEAEPHTYGAVGTADEFTCTVCGYERGDKHTHTYEWKSNEGGHWEECTVCHIERNREEHDKQASDGYHGTCGEAVTCDTCGYVVLPANSTHELSTDEWQINDECHYRMCMRKGCGGIESFVHTALSDGDCMTPDVCSICGYEMVAASEGHSWVVAKDGHTEEGHRQVCSVEGCNAESIAAHEAGTRATCTGLAECKYCHWHFGEVDIDNHVGGTEIRNVKEATETEEGYTGDTYCTSCNTVIEKGKTIPKIEKGHVHTFDTYVYDQEGHYKICSECEERESTVQTPHTLSDYIIDEENGNHYRVCEVCGYKESGSHEHESENFDCTKPLLCKDCGAVVVEACKEHDFSGRITGETEGHMMACINRNCSVTSPSAPHSGGIATCTDGAHCEVCDVEYTIFDPNNHVGGTELRGQKNATTTEEGYTGDSYCLGCNSLIMKGTVIEKLPEEHKHVFGAWVSDTAHHWKECECGDITQKAEHTYEKGVCTVCGAVDPNYTNTDVLIDEAHGVLATPEENSEDYHGIRLVVETITETMAELYEQVEETVGEQFEEYLPLDIKLIDIETGNIETPKGKLVIKVPVPHGWLAADTTVYHVDETGMTELPTTPSEDDAYVTFTVNHFSIYVLVNTSTKLEKHEHVFGEWQSDAAYHWKACDCGEVTDRAKHTYEDGVCTVCGVDDPNYKDPGDTEEPGDTEDPGDTTDPGDTEDPGNTTAPGDTEDPGDTTAPGDITDPGDTTAPGDITDPEDTTAPDNTTDTVNPTQPEAPKTGDETDIAVIAVLMMLSLGGIWIIVDKKRKYGK